MHSLLQILVPVDICIKLEAQKGKPELIEPLIVEFHGFAVNRFQEIGKCLRVIQACDDWFIYREGCSFSGKYPQVVHTVLSLDDFHERFHNLVHARPCSTVTAPDNERPAFIPSLAHIYINRDGTKERH